MIKDQAFEYNFSQFLRKYILVSPVTEVKNHEAGKKKKYFICKTYLLIHYYGLITIKSCISGNIFPGESSNCYSSTGHFKISLCNTRY